jgi:RNA polymerase sigma-70 factor (ECF subfamily)
VVLRLAESIEDKYANDADLAARCLRGDQSAQRELFREHFGRVHATTFRILGSAHEAEDAAQETFAEAFRSLATFEGRARLGTWIDRIGVRVSFRIIRDRKARRTSLELVSDDFPAENEAAADRRVFAREGLRRLYQALAAIPPTTRIAFVLHVIDGRSMAEAADLTEASVVATKVRVWRARRALERHAATDPVLQEFVSKQAGEVIP